MSEDINIISGDSLQNIRNKVKNAEEGITVFSKNKKQYILLMKPLLMEKWLLTAIVPMSAVNSQTNRFLLMTMVLLGVLGAVIGILLIVSFVSFKNTIILNNSKEIFYREKLFNLFSNHIDDVFAIFDIGTKQLEYISDNIERTLGITKLDFIHNPNIFINSLPDETRKIYKNKMLELKRKLEKDEMQPVEMEFQWQKSNKEERWLLISMYPVVADFLEGKNSCCIQILSDRTKSKQIEKELSQALESANRAAESKSTFLSNMSHEIRTPLNGIMGFLELMQKKFVNPLKQEEYLVKAQNSAKYLLSLINDILDMSKIDSGKYALENISFSLEAVIGQVQAIIALQAGQKGIRFNVEISGMRELVYGDPLRLQQIIMNLLSNAVKFTPVDGQIRLTAKSERIDNKQRKITFTISDTGCGMSDDFKMRIWEPFEQERLNTARKYGGTGLGLAISHQLVNMMKGSIYVSSELGQGSTFIVVLPFEAAGSMDSIAEENRECDKIDLSGSTLLVAEDNEINIEIITELLNLNYINVITAQNGEQAVNLFRQSGINEINAILMDLQMPKMDGYEAADIIRSMNRKDAKAIPIIACTANAFSEEAEEVKKHGMNEHIPKPVDMEQLLKILSNYLTGRNIQKQ